jgi:3',5'-cyclic AMP phosphodiesterase CpdA
MDFFDQLFRLPRRSVRRGPITSAAVALMLLLATPAPADLSGSVFVDVNRNGVRDGGEPPRAGVAVSNGLDVVRTDAEGRYSLAKGPRGFIFLTRPAGFDCEDWYRRGPGDFALTQHPTEEEFFFVHMSDLHVFDRPGELIEEFGLGDPWWAPSTLVAWFTLRRIDEMLVPRFSLDPVEDLRKALSPYRDVSDLSDTGVYLAYRDEFMRPGSELGNVRGKVEGALGEIAALRPSFVLATGDLVLDANRAPHEVLERRLELYRSATASMGVPVYSTIGNHELRGVVSEGTSGRESDYGLGLFEATFGPTYYSFDRGAFHFVALDTHRPGPGQEDPREWAWNRMRDEVKHWLRRDLDAHGDRVKVVLNHEPFFSDPSWPLDAEELAKYVVSDEGIFEEQAVAYSLNGHVHSNGLERGEHTTHISVGSLFGMGWYLPPDLYPRGYRIYYARGGQLYGAWKLIGEPLLGFVQPQGEDAIHPASSALVDSESLEGPFDLVAVAADAEGPLEAVSLELDGRPVRLERWGDYFVHARIDPAPLQGHTATLTLFGRRESGETLRARLEIRARD